MINHLRFIILILLVVLIGAGSILILLPKTLAVPQQQNSNDNFNLIVKMIRIKPSGYKPQPVSPESIKGQDLLINMSCMACHSVRNSGASIGPILDGIGGKRNAEYLLAKLTDNESARNRYAELTEPGRDELFPHIRIPQRAAESIVTFLLTLHDPPGEIIIETHNQLPRFEVPINPSFEPAPQTANSQAGAILFGNTGCIACHSIANHGGWLAPALDGVGGRRSHEFIVEQITNPREHVASINYPNEGVISQMPHFVTLTHKEIEQLADFLETLPNRKK